MTDEVWFAALPDGEAGLAAAHVLRPWATRLISHDSGGPGCWAAGPTGM
ncbi:hypothetical protein ACFQ2B_06005 [Streptomyces stramineus]